MPHHSPPHSPPHDPINPSPHVVLTVFTKAKKGQPFGHVLVTISREHSDWLTAEWTRSGGIFTTATACPAPVLIDALIAHGCTIAMLKQVHLPLEPRSQFPSMPWIARNCVGVAKLILGISCPWIVTPSQLQRRLVARHRAILLSSLSPEHTRPLNTASSDLTSSS